MAKSVKVGDTVSWNSPGGASKGKVVEKRTTPRTIKGHTAAASKAEPQYVVESAKSGKKAAHKAGALKKA